MKPYAIIVNPNAGRKKGRRTADELEKELTARAVSYQRFNTKGVGDGEQIAASLNTEAFSHVLVVGGDGTLNEVVRGLYGKSEIPIAIFPAGTGNDVARLLGLHNKAAALKAALSGMEKVIDIGLADGVPFVNIFSFGLDAAIATQANLWKEKLPGWLLYPAALLKTVFSFRPMDITLTIVDAKGVKTKKQEKLMLMAVCNGSHYGGGMNINPLADPQDGLLELCIVRAMPWWKIIALFPTVYKGKHLQFKEVSLERVTAVQINASQEMLMNRDGETWTDHQAAISLVQGALKMKVLQEQIINRQRNE